MAGALRRLNPDPEIAVTTTTLRRLTVAETANLHAFGEIDVDLATNQARHSAGEARGFYGQNLTGREHLPEALTRLALYVAEREIAAVALDPSWTVEQVWTACQAGARYAIYAGLGDAPKRDEAYSRLTWLGLKVAAATPPKTEGGPLAWDMTFFEVSPETGRLEAHLVLV